jgi:hypothetical protein
MWAHSGRELLFRAKSGDMMAVPVVTGNTFEAGTPAKLFNASHYVEDDRHHEYDVSPDDQKFIVVRNSRNSQTLGGVVNWGADIKRLSRK